MTDGGASPERLAAFSDGVMAIIITIMVLELKAPHGADMADLLALWPTFAAYALSYLFVALVWVNHHHLLRYTEEADALVIWTNFGFLFFVSLIPFFTHYMAENRIDAFTTALYAAVFLCITVAFDLFQWAITRQRKDDEAWKRAARVATWRNWLAVLFYALAIPAAYLNPMLSLGIIFVVGLFYAMPDALRCLAQR